MHQDEGRARWVTKTCINYYVSKLLKSKICDKLVTKVNLRRLWFLDFVRCGHTRSCGICKYEVEFLLILYFHTTGTFICKSKRIEVLLPSV